MSAPMIEIAGVGKSFGAHEVLRGVDLAVARSEVVCLIGPSGSGKSTLLRCVNFLETYDAGEVRIDGRLIGYEDAGDGTRRPMSARELARDAARDRHGVPALQPLAAHDRARQRRRAAAARARPAARRGGRAGDGDADPRRPRRQGRRLSRRVSRAASSSASPSPGRWRCSRGSCCSTSRPRRSIPSWSAKCWK